MIDTLTVENLTFEIRRSSSRHTIGITIGRKGELILHAPDECSETTLEDAARQKLFWVYEKLELKQLISPPTPPKRYIDGETFFYLGRTYRLKLVDENSSNAILRLHGGWFQLKETHCQNAEQHFINWYMRSGQKLFERRVEAFARRMNVQPRSVYVRDLGYRWGSCGKHGDIYFHWQTATLPLRIIDYVVVHELTHLNVAKHTPEFWQHIGRVIPDYASRKLWLAENGSHFGF